MLFGRRKRTIKRILLVEDEPLIAFDNEHFLSDAGYVIAATVDRVDAALAVIRGDEELDLVLADVSLSDGGDGLDVARAAHAADVPVLFVTGNCPVGAREIAVGCLAKPYLPRDLLAAIEAVDGMLSGKPPKKLPAGLSLFGDAAGGES